MLRHFKNEPGVLADQCQGRYLFKSIDENLTVPDILTGTCNMQNSSLRLNNKVQQDGITPNYFADIGLNYRINFLIIVAVSLPLISDWRSVSE